jgi:hypothetical protein
VHAEQQGAALKWGIFVATSRCMCNIRITENGTEV